MKDSHALCSLGPRGNLGAEDYHIVDETDAQLSVMDVRGKERCAGTVCFGTVYTKRWQTLLHKILEGDERAFAAWRPLHPAFFHYMRLIFFYIKGL